MNYRHLFFAGWIGLVTAGQGSAQTSSLNQIDTLNTTNPKTKRSQRKKKILVVNRAYQVALARNLRAAEVKEIVGQTSTTIISNLIKNPDVQTIYAKRLSLFSRGSSPNSRPLTNVRPSQDIVSRARPQAPIRDAVNKITERHGGSICAKGTEVKCFAEWMSKTVMPGKSVAWLQAESDLENWSYARLVERIVNQSVKDLYN